MCCEECPKYERCEQDNRLKDNCCPKCPEYHDCLGMDEREGEPDRDFYRDTDNEGYSEN